ncbi:MAG: hypothetical protein LBU56_01470 [Rickettsiales bacterium]|jgi:hypothetical protein|nr:hypothetical protein [Rickettsiales bacterium]
MTNLDFVKELVNAFNINNYSSKVNTNFVVEGSKIVVKFNCDQDAAEKYLLQMARGLIREYFPDESVVGHFFNLKSFPFNFDKGRWTRSGAVTKFTVPIDSGVIFNLKVHFAEESEIDVKNRMVREIDEKRHLGKELIYKLLNENIKAVSVSKSSRYIKCLLFNQPNVQTYFVGALKAQMEVHGCNYLDFYDIDYKDKKIYFKDVENIGFIRSAIELSKKMVGYNFNFPSSHDSKVRNYKNAMSWLIFSLTKIPIHRYYYDEFIDESRIRNGDNFAFIPAIEEDNSLRYLKYMEADKINAKFSYGLLTDVRGQTKGTESDKFGDVYAFSDRQVALLIPVIIENSVINEDGQLEINPELLEQLRSRSPSTDISDTELESPKRNQEKQIRKSPRRGSERGAGGETWMLSQEAELHHNVNSSNRLQQPVSAAALDTDESVQGAGGKVDNETKKEILRNFIHVLPHQNNQKFWLEILLSLFSPKEVEKLYSDLSSPCGREKLYSKFHLSPEWCKRMEFEWSSQLSILLKEQAGLSQQPVSAAALDADESVQEASGGFSASLTLGESDLGEDSAKAESESPKKHGVLCKVKSFFSNKSDQHDENFERHDVRRDSTKSAPVHPASKKQPDPKQHNTFPTRKGNLSSVPSPIKLKEGCSLESSYLKYELVDGSTYVSKLTQEDIVEGKRRVLYEFISYLPFKINKKPEREEMLTSLSSCSHKEVEDLYLSFSSPDKRKKLCSKLPFYHGKNKCQVEFLWKEVHQSYAEKLSMLKIPERLKQSSDLVRNKPGCRDSIASKDSAYLTGSPASQRSSTSSILGPSHEGESLRSFSSCASFLSEPSTSGSVLCGTSKYSPDSSDEDEFFRNPVEYVLSRISKSPTDSSISSNTSSETVVEHDTENKGAFLKNSPSSQMDLVQLVSSDQVLNILNI